MQFSHRQLMIFSGAVWCLIGIFLLNLGLKFLIDPAGTGQPVAAPWILPTLTPLIGSREAAALLLMILALAVGFLKGKYVITKSAQQAIQRILGLPNPVSFFQVYALKYYILLGLMIGLGVLMKVLNVPSDIRGCVDIAVGAALVQGAQIYFRCAMQMGKNYL